jgi:anti-sigma regulatory factor (Ser/Thr protein kinase)
VDDTPSGGSERLDDRVETVLPATTASPGVARRFVAAALRRWNTDAPTVEAAQLLVSELVTNAIVHTTSDVRLAVSRRRGMLRVEVSDRDDGMPRMRTVGPETVGGRGLGIVDGLADTWGTETRREGKAVWFELSQ